MPRLPYKNRDEVADDVGAALDRQRERTGYELNLTRMLAYAPEFMRGFNAVGGYLLGRSSLDPVLRELAILTVGRLTQSAYEFEHHAEIGLRAGVTREQIAALGDWGRSPLFDERQRAAIRYAWQATERVHVADTVVDAVREHLDDAQFFDLVATVAFYNLVVRFLEPLQIEPEPALRAALAASSPAAPRPA